MLYIIQRIDQFISTTDNQFGFKQSHSTDMCIYLLKEMAAYHKETPNYTVCYIY